MATSHEPGFLGGDLPDKERQAYEEGHDADLLGDKTTTSSVGDHAEDLEKGPATATTAVKEPQDPNIVTLDASEDPMCWTDKKKWTNIGVLSIITLLIPLGSSFFAPGVPRVLAEFHIESDLLATFVVSVYILGFAFGPLVVAPLSELYGRLWIYHICNALFICFTIGAALAPSMNSLIGFRFLQGMSGVAPLTLGGGTIADIMAPEKRGGAMAVWAMGPLLGPVIGPVCGGFLAEDVGWRWIFWVLAIAVAIFAALALVVLRETYAPAILDQKVKRLQKETGNMNLRSKLDSNVTPKQLFILALVRPAKLMFLSPICALMSLYMAVVYGVLYLLFTTFTFVFEGSYGFSESIVGLVYIGLGAGMILGLGLLGWGSDKLLKNLAAKNDGKAKPEFRLPPLIIGAPFIPAGLFIYGWTAQYHVQWIAPIFGTLLVGVGLIAAFMCINTYLIDAYSRYAASAMAANTVLRSLFGALLPLAGLTMYDVLGLGWGNSLLGFITFALCAVPVCFWFYGERLRTSPRFQVKL